MANMRWFKPGRPVTRIYPVERLVFGCILTAVASVSLAELSHLRPDIMSASRSTVADLLVAALVMPVVIPTTHGYARWWALWVSVTSILFVPAAWGALHVLGDGLTRTGIGSPLHEPLLFYSAALLLMPVVLWLSFVGMVAAVWQSSPELRLWTRRSGWRGRLPPMDRGLWWWAAVVFALVADWLPTGLSRPTRAAAIACLLIPASAELVRWARARGAQGIPAGISTDRQRRWVCARLGVPASSEAPSRILMSHGVWFGYPLVIVNVGDGGVSQWLICSAEVRRGKKLWSVTLAQVARLRPDLAPLTGLPPGWVATTDPPDVFFDPDVAARVAGAVEGCEIIDMTGQLVYGLEPCVS